MQALLFENQTDEQLIELSQGGNDQATDALLTRYKGLVRKIARTFFLVGGETDDLEQEGMLGLCQAVIDYQLSKKKSSFKTFAYVCVKRRILDAVKSAARKKNAQVYTFGALPMDEWETDEPSPEEKMILLDDQREFNQKISRILSDFEFKIVVMYMDGLTALEISETLGKPFKSVDNAIQRSKRKLQEMFKR